VWRPHAGRVRSAVATGAVAVVAIAVGVALVVARAHHGAPRLSQKQVPFDLRPGARGTLFVPGSIAGRVTLVVMAPGGGWVAADPRGLYPLADGLAAAGIAAATITYRTETDGSHFPVPVADVLCGVDAAVAQAKAQGFTPSRVLLLGHSAGAQLAALAGLTGDRYQGPCSSPSARVDGVIGLAGPYDIAKFSSNAEALLGTTPDADPQSWRAANPMTWVRERPDVPFLLSVGSADDLVDPSFTTNFASALQAAGHRVQVVTITGGNHFTVFGVKAILGPIVDWVHSLN